MVRQSARPGVHLGGLAPEVIRAQQQSMHGLERMRLHQQSELVQQKARQRSHRLAQESVKLRTDIRDHAFAARERAFATSQSDRTERELISRERASVASERVSFDHEVKRREASFRSYEVEARRRAAERVGVPRLQPQRRLVPPPLASETELEMFAAFDRAFEDFEAGADLPEQAGLPMASLPWPPEEVPVSGVRRSDSDVLRKQRLKKAMLRWHPDKCGTGPVP